MHQLQRESKKDPWSTSGPGARVIQYLRVAMLRTWSTITRPRPRFLAQVLRATCMYLKMC